MAAQDAARAADLRYLTKQLARAVKGGRYALAADLQRQIERRKRFK